MGCSHPLKAFPIGVNPSGKTKYMITSYKVHHVECRRGNWYPCMSSDLSPFRDRSVSEFIEVPCGNCTACRLAYSRDWANRCSLELGYHKSAYFVTLTYSPDFVPRVDYIDGSTGELLEALTLRKRDFQLFMKRLRKRFSDQHIRYFAAGEYGSKTFRPHYHAIIFGLELDDLLHYKTVRLDDGTCYSYYTSKSLSECWIHTHGREDSSEFSNIRGDNTPLIGQTLGFVVVGQVNWHTCAYTARYVMKKLKGPEAEFYRDHNIEPPFTVMSRKPGIARQYYDDHPDLYQHKFINLSTPEGGKKIMPPRYYDKLYDLDCPEDSKALKELRRRLAQERTAAKLAQTDFSYEEYLQVEEDALEDRIKSLRRNL